MKNHFEFASLRKAYILLAVYFSLFSFHVSFAQGWGGAGRGKIGHFYGKVVDSVTGKPVAYAAVQLSGQQWDSVSQQSKTVVLAGQLTKINGDFSLEKLPVSGKFTLQIQFIGYLKYERTISFNVGKLRRGQKSRGGDDNSSAQDNIADAVDKDLGNIKLKPDAATLKGVTIEGNMPMELKLDRRVFDVSKNITTVGGTAEDVLKNVPGVNVDIDGNVTLRNASPQIYVDGLPTVLTIDQIPADDIDKIEVITNPSAKFDASAGSGGIINIVMKQNRQIGYNGTIRGGIDERGKINSGASLNVRQSKINIFGNVFYHQVDHDMYGQETRDYTSTPVPLPGQPATPLTDVTQHDTNIMNGNFLTLRGGLDYFMDNRNTFTLSGSYGSSVFTTQDNLHNLTDTLPSNNSTTYFKNSPSQRTFQNDGLRLTFKHLFPKQDEDLIFNVLGQHGTSNSNGYYYTQYYNMNDSAFGNKVIQQLQNTSTNNRVVIKTDFEDPVSAKIKLEAGEQVTVSQSNSVSNNYLYNYSTENFQLDNTGINNFNFNQQVYAVYGIFSQNLSSRISYQAGVRVESAYYQGELITPTQTQSINSQFPFEPFPSAYITYHLTDKSDLQFNYARHVQRPSISQLNPYINYADSLNLTEGNPKLNPAYNNSAEINYLQYFDRKNTLLLGLYYKYTTGIITTVQQTIYDTLVRKNEFINIYENANSGYSYGAEITSVNSITKYLDVISNLNLYQSGINGQNLPATVSVNDNIISWFAKLNLTFKLPYNFNVQLNGNYLSKSVIPAGGSGGGRWGGGGGGGYGGGGGITPSAQGYILPNYWLDVAVKKDFFKNKSLSATFNVHDVFATAVSSSYTVTDDYTQSIMRRRDPQFFRFVLSYKFGQTDFALFKRKDKDTGVEENPDQQEMQGGEQNN
jgi:outer membrane receptor protein involved in Fe transport